MKVRKQTKKWESSRLKNHPLTIVEILAFHWQVTAVKLQHVNSPARQGLWILHIVTNTSWIAAAGLIASIYVDAKLEAFTVYL